MADERLRVAVIGLGFGARVQVPAFQRLPETTVVGVCSSRLERARIVAREHGVAVATNDYRVLLRDPTVEAVSIATPPHLHHQFSVAAALAGKHILCEKPLARTVAEARDMLRQAEAHGLTHMVDHELRFRPERQHFKTLIDQGFIGEPRSISATLFRDSLADPEGRPHPWLLERDKGGGMLGAVGSHLIDALLWWFGPILGVTGRLATTVRGRRDPASGQPRLATADDTAAFLVQFASGALGSVHISGAAWHGSGERIEAYGSAGALVLTAQGTLLGRRRGERAAQEIAPPPLARDLPAGTPPALAPFMHLARVFVGAARTGQPAAPSFEDGLRVQEILNGVQRAAQHGQWQTIGRPPRPTVG